MPESGLLWSPWFRIIATKFLGTWWADLTQTITTGKKKNRTKEIKNKFNFRTGGQTAHRLSRQVLWLKNYEEMKMCVCAAETERACSFFFCQAAQTATLSSVNAEWRLTNTDRRLTNAVLMLTGLTNAVSRQPPAVVLN